MRAIAVVMMGWQQIDRPPSGLAAARIEARALRVAWIPALAMEMVCCSIASCMATWSRMARAPGPERVRGCAGQTGVGLSSARVLSPC